MINIDYGTLIYIHDTLVACELLSSKHTFLQHTTCSCKKHSTMIASAKSFDKIFSLKLDSIVSLIDKQT